MKPIRTEVLDHTTILAREQACHAELRLNRRLAASAYLAVVPVVTIEGGLRAEAAGPPVDWLVKMRRLPRDRMLDTCITRRTVQPADVGRLARILEILDEGQANGASEAQLQRLPKSFGALDPARVR